MKKFFILLSLFALSLQIQAQTNPVITAFLRNNTNIKGRHYVAGNSTPIQDNVLANVQSVQYSGTWSYIKATGIPAYITGPFLDGNPSIATAQTGYFKLPLNPAKNNGNPSPTTGGNIGVFINGVALFDYRDGVSWQSSSQSLKGGPLGGMGDMVWNRDAVVAERLGFDCSKGHPAMGNYHHHQNPSAFKLDLTVISTVCNLYLADGLYTIDSTKHSPLLGFAYDGFPIYGAYGYKNTDGTGGLVRMRSSYQLRNISLRTHYANGTDVTDGPAVSNTYPLGYFREDYEYLAHNSPEYLDDHNGRFCVTPEYPQGTYAYFCTVNPQWNSAYPYAVGPTFYGIKNASKVTTVSEPTTTYNGPPLSLVPTITQINCFGNANGSINLAISGGNPPYTYHWDNNSSSPNRMGLLPGTYSVTVTDVTAQTITQSVTIVQPATALSASVAISPVNCFGNADGMVQLNPTGGTSDYTYLWNDGSTAQNRQGLSAGNYTLTLTDANFCATTLSVDIPQPAAALTVALNSTPVACFGNATGSIQLSPSGGTADYHYYWNDGATTQNRLGLPAGAYTATITDAQQCSATLSAEITQPAATLSANPAVQAVACFGNATGIIQLNPTGGTAPYAYLWSDGSTAENRTTLLAGNYALTLSDANNCTFDIAADIVQPAELSLLISTLNATCGEQNGSIDLTASGGVQPFQFAWSTGSSAQNLSVLSTGSYTVTLTDANGCSQEQSAMISNLDAATANLTAISIPCFGQYSGALQLEITAGIAPFQFLWNDGSSEEDRSDLPAGAYSVTIQDANHCLSILSANIQQPDALISAATTLPEACASHNGAAQLTISGGIPPYSVLWSNGSTDASLSALAVGTYSATVTDANGCNLPTSVQIAAIDGPAFQLTSTDIRCFGEANGAIDLSIFDGTAPYSILWSTGWNDGHPVGLNAGTYAFTVTDTRGCSVQGTETLEQPASPLLVSATAHDIDCYGEQSGYIILNAIGGTAPYVYNGASNPSLSGLAAGVYDFTVVDAQGCVFFLTQSLVQPSAPLSISVSTTPATPGTGGSATIEASGGTLPYTYNWSNGSIGNQQDSLSPGDYTISVTDEHGCTNSSTFTIELNSATTELNTAFNLQVFPNPSAELIIVQAMDILSNSLYVTLYNGSGQMVRQQEFYQGSTICFIETETLYDGLYVLSVSDGTMVKTYRVAVCH